MGASYNKGEWSEFYVFLYMLGTGALPIDVPADGPAGVYTVLGAYRDEPQGRLTYLVDSSSEMVIILSESGEEVFPAIPQALFRETSATLLASLKLGDKSPADVLKFAEQIGVTEIKGGSSKRKIDIEFKLVDSKNGFEWDAGFSIKSGLGADSTLLNGTGSTVFRFEVQGDPSDQLVKAYNEPKFSRANLAHILQSQGLSLQILGLVNTKFRDNLAMIDSAFPEIVADGLRRYYSAVGPLSIRGVIKAQLDSPVIVGLHSTPARFLEYKWGQLLSASARGMMPNTAWDGRAEARGGVIVVDAVGLIRSYHFHLEDELRDYLLDSADFETPSTGRSKMGKMVRGDDGKVTIDLTLQIRLKKPSTISNRASRPQGACSTRP